MDDEDRNDGSLANLSTNAAIRKRRGAPKGIKSKPGVRNIEFNEMGNAIGIWAKDYKHHLGETCRRKVSILYESWNDVPQGIKDTIWEDIQREFQLEDEVMKKKVLQHTAKVWRDFKNKLVLKHIKTTSIDGPPYEIYNFISYDDWKEFERRCTSSPFKEKSEKARKSQEFNKYPHHMGSKSYAEMEPVWGRKGYYGSTTGATSESSTSGIYSSVSSFLKRTTSWLLARSKKDKQGNLMVPDKETQQVKDSIDEWKKKQEEGEFIPTRGDDVLTRALGKKDRSGRALGVGTGVGFRALWGTPEGRTTRTSRRETDEEIEERVSQRYSAKLDAMVQERFILFAQQMGMEIPSHILLGDKGTTNANDAPASCPPHQAEQFDPFTALTDACPCNLAVIIGPNCQPVVVANGTFYPKLFLDHTTEMRSDCVRVSVDYCYPNYTAATVPFPSPHIRTVGQAHGTFVQWPKDQVLLDEETVLKFKEAQGGCSNRVGGTPEMSNMGVGSGHASNDPNTYLLTNLALENVANLSYKCRQLMDVVNTATANAVFNLTCTPRMFGYSGTVQVTREDITQLLTGAWLNVSVIQVFIMALSEMCDTNDATMNSIGFMCPSMISHTMAKNDPDGVTQYMTDLLTAKSSTRFLLCPFHSLNHWILLAVCIPKREVYVFDSLSKKKNLWNQVTPWKCFPKI